MNSSYHNIFCIAFFLAFSIVYYDFLVFKPAQPFGYFKKGSNKVIKNSHDRNLLFIYSTI